MDPPGLQVFLPEVINQTGSHWQGHQPFRISLFRIARLADWRRVRIVNQPSVVCTESAREGRNHELGLASLECTSDPLETRLNDLVGKLKIVETLSKVGKLLILATLQLFFGFLVTMPPSIAFCKKFTYRKGWCCYLCHD